MLAVVVGVPLQIDLVEHHRRELAPHLLELIEGAAQGGTGAALLSHHEHEAVHEGAEHGRVGHGQDGWRVHQDPVVLLAQSVQQLAQALRAQKLRRVRRDVQVSTCARRRWSIIKYSRSFRGSVSRSSAGGSHGF